MIESADCTVVCSLQLRSFFFFLFFLHLCTVICAMSGRVVTAPGTWLACCLLVSLLLASLLNIKHPGDCPAACTLLHAVAPQCQALAAARFGRFGAAYIVMMQGA